jgi:hypothetical protein
MISSVCIELKEYIETNPFASFNGFVPHNFTDLIEWSINLNFNKAFNLYGFWLERFKQHNEEAHGDSKK